MAAVPGIDHFYALQESPLSIYFTDENVKCNSQVLRHCLPSVNMGRKACPP